MTQILKKTNGTLSYRHDNGEQSNVTIEIAGMRTMEIRIATLLHEVNDREIKEALTKYGEVLDIKEEFWTTSYRYKVSNGVRLAQIKLKQHLPSRIIIAGHTVDITAGQPQTCFACNEIVHIFQHCPHRRRGNPKEGCATPTTWTQFAAPNMRHKMTAQKETMSDYNSQTQDREKHNSDHTDTLSFLDVLTNNLTPTSQQSRDTDKEVGGLDGGGNAAPTVTGTTSDMARNHEGQPTPLTGH
jgi:hypothetical protein